VSKVTIPEAARWQFTTTEYERMAEAGILSEDDRVELVEGEVLKMTPIGSRHAACVNRLNTLVSQQVGGSVIVSVQNPVRLTQYTEPQPDLALLRPRADFYSEGHPAPEDVLLIVEVAETSLGYDRDVKLPLYARAGIPEVWIVDLDREEILAYSRPREGAYGESERELRGGTVSSRVLPGLALEVGDVIGGG
jgi:Uma2 family endonuclease